MTDPIITEFKEPARTQMLNKLWELQRSSGHINDEAVRQLAAAYNISEIEVEGVVSFYHFFHHRPTGKYTIYLNNSIVSDIKGFNRIKETFERETGTYSVRLIAVGRLVSFLRLALVLVTRNLLH